MFFLLRSAFWLSLLIMLIPVDQDLAGAQTSTADRVAPFDALYAAQETLSDVGGFCERSPTACMVGSELLNLFALKAQSGIKMAFEYFEEPATAAAPTAAPAAGTLSDSDLAPEWRGAGEAI